MAARFAFAVGVVIAVALATSAQAVPPPPAGPAATEMASRLTSLFNDRDFEAYGALFADDVKVFDGDKPLATNKAEWLAEVRRQADGPWQRLIPRAVSADSETILIVEEVSSIGPHREHAIQDCCWWGRAARYTVSNGKIVEVRFLTGRLPFVRVGP